VKSHPRVEVMSMKWELPSVEVMEMLTDMSVADQRGTCHRSCQP
jgi:hypothetical protein